MSDDHFLARWSRRKHAAKAASAAGPDRPTADAAPAQAGAPSPVIPITATEAAAAPAPELPLPPVESLTPESDFAPFMREHVEESLKRRALKTLFQDERFNVMDGLDVYIDDYSKPDPLPAGWLEKMNQATRLGAYEAPVEEPQTSVKEEASGAVCAESGETPPREGSIPADSAGQSDTSTQPFCPTELPQSGRGT